MKSIATFYSTIETKQFKINDIFDVNKGERIVKKNRVDGEIPLITAGENNNGIATYLNEDIFRKSKKLFSQSITVDMFFNCFYHDYTYFADDNVHILTPKKEYIHDISNNLILLFFTTLLKQNKFRFSYGRQVRLSRIGKIEIELPIIKKDETYIPAWKSIMTFMKNQGLVLDKFQSMDNKLLFQDIILDVQCWREFTYEELFEIKKGKRLTKANMRIGNIPFIGSTDSNNGVTATVGQKPIHKGNTITVNYNGSVGEAFYQPLDFYASDDVNVLYPREELFNEFNQYIAHFIIAVIKLEQFKFNYGRKWKLERMNKSIIKLPVIDNQIDVELMENYIKTLPFSSSI